MKRRNFVATAGTIGVATAVSGATVASSTYSSISSGMLLKEFTPVSKNVLDRFSKEVRQNFIDLGMDEKLVKQMTVPVQIIRNKTKEGQESIVFKNKSGDYISLTCINGVDRIAVSKTLN